MEGGAWGQQGGLSRLEVERPALARSPASVFNAFLSRLGRFGTIFATGLLLQLVLGLITTVLTTHFLTPAEYGGLALYLLVPSVITVFSNLGMISGTASAVFGGDEEDGVEQTAPQPGGHHDPRSALMTGLVLSLALGAVLVAACTVFSSQLSHVLGGSSDGPLLIEIGAISGVLAGGWRLLTNMLRYAKRPLLYSIVHVSRAALSLVFVAALLVGGRAVLGVILGFAIGTAGAFVIAIVANRRELTFAFDWAAARHIISYGSGWTFVVLSYYIIQTFGVLVLAPNSSQAAVGVFSFAMSIAVLGNYAVSSFVYAWGTVLNSPLHLAVMRERGEGRSNGALLEGYVVGAATMVVGFAAFSGVAVQIAPASYAGAATLLPLLVLTPVGRGCFQLTYSLSPRLDKRGLKIKCAILALAIFIAAGLFLGARLHGVGVGIAAAAAFFIPAGIQLISGQRSTTPLSLEWRRLVLPPLIAVPVVLGTLALNLKFGVLEIAVGIATVVGFVAILTVIGVIPRDALRRLQLRSRLARGRRGRSARELADRVAALPLADQVLVSALLRDHQPVELVAGQRGESEDAMLTHFIAALAKLTELDAPPAQGCTIARYVLFRGPAGDRHLMLGQVISAEVDPLVLDRLEQTVAALRRLPRAAAPTEETDVAVPPLGVAGETANGDSGEDQVVVAADGEGGSGEGGTDEPVSEAVVAAAAPVSVVPEPVVEPAEPVVEAVEPVVEPVAEAPTPLAPEPLPSLDVAVAGALDVDVPRQPGAHGQRARIVAGAVLVGLYLGARSRRGR